MESEVVFSKEEVDFINSQLLARIGTASPKGRPDVAVMGFDFDGTYFYVSGPNNEATWKYKNAKRNPRASLVFDDLPSMKPWRTRGSRFSAVWISFTMQGNRRASASICGLSRRKYSWGLNKQGVP